MRSRTPRAPSSIRFILRICIDTLELNPTEIDRFRRSLTDVVNGKAPLQPLLQGRDKASRERPPKVAIETKFGFDDNSSEHSTLLEIVRNGSAWLAL